MNKFWLVIKKEYLERVRKWSFILLTLLAPLFFIGIFAVQAFFMTYTGGSENYLVVDESKLDWEKLKGNESGSVKLTYSKENYEKLKNNYSSNNFSGILFIPEISIDKPEGIEIYSDKLLGIRTKLFIESQIENAVKDLQFKKAGIDEDKINSFSKKVSIKQQGLSESKSADTIVATAIGYISGFITYFVLIFYGIMVMKGVAEEKTSRIVEVILSSIKPVHLMLGKIIGIGLVGLTQFSIWIGLALTAFTVAGAFFNPDLSSLDSMQNLGPDAAEFEKSMSQIISTVKEINFTPIIIGFLVFFIGGYFFYAALYAIMGVAMGENNDQSQSLNMIITTPLILAIFAITAIINEPNGSLAIWTSFIPFFSPIVMPVRLAFGIPLWQTILSIIILIISFVLATYLAAKIYRVGILMYGKKITLKEIWRWVVY